MDFLLFEDRQLANTLDITTVELLQRLDIIKKDNVERVHYCGVLVTNAKTLLFLPRNSFSSIDSSCFSPPALARKLVLALHKYRSSKFIGSSGDINETLGLDILSDIIWLLHDYINNGIYSAKIKKKNFNQGNINWKKTIRKEIPFMGVEGVPVYLKLHSEKTKFNEQNNISLIHAEVIKALDVMFSWIITGDESIRISSDIDYIPNLCETLEYKCMVLKKELASTYSDRETKLLSSLISYLSNSSEGLKGDYIIGVKSFQGVWEEMLRVTLPNVKPINHLLPKPALYMRGSNNFIQTRGMLTDIVSFVGSSVSIIDAKYYRAEGFNDSPGWSDIVKQLYYAKAIQSLDDQLKISNWFAFPGKHESINDGPIKAIGLIDPKSQLALNDEFPSIGCAYFCPIDILNRYTNNLTFSISEIEILHQPPNV